MTEAQIAAKRGLSLETMRLLRIGRNLDPADVCAATPRLLARAIEKSLYPPNPDLPDQALLWRAGTLKDEHGVIPPDGLLKAHEHVRQMKERQLSKPNPEEGLAGIENNFWTWIGPGNVGGRVRALVIHPTSPNIIWAGSASGGIWKTIDGGASWAPVDDFMANLAVTSLVIDPTDPGVMYAATGEGFQNIDAIRGAGIFKSNDGGETWVQLENTATMYYVNRVAVSHDGNTLLAATNAGIYRSTDKGQTWSLTTNGCTLGRDVDFNPIDSSKAVAGCGDGNARFSTDGGATWTTATPAFAPPANGLLRWEVAYAPSSPNTVYASVDRNGGELYVSSNGGQAYGLQNTGTFFLNNGQGWYDNALWVDPTSSANVIVGGVDLFRSTNFGINLDKISNWTQAPNLSAHADHHVIVSSPGFGTSNFRVFFGNDGGVYKTENAYTVDDTSGWQELNNGLGITQFYGAGSDGLHVVGGTQDNGTLVFNGDPEGWTSTFGGDGGFSAIDKFDPNYLYGEYVFLNLHRSTTGGGAPGSEYIAGQHWNGSAYVWKGAGFRIDDAMPASPPNANFIAPFVLDPSNSNRILAGGRRLWRTNDARSANTAVSGPAWSVIKGSIGSAATDNISAIAVHETNPDLIYVGHNNGNVYRTTNGTAATPTWTQVDTLGLVPLPNRQVLRIMIDPTNASVVYVAFAGFSSDNLYRSTDFGNNWTPRVGSGGNTLPAAPVRSIVQHPLNNSRLYVGTEVGVFVSEDQGATWSLPQDGPANVSVDELFWGSFTTLYAATHGRGVYRVEVGTSSQNVAVTFVEPSTTVAENGGTAVLPVVLTTSDGANLASGVTVNYSTSNGTAIAGSDFTTTGGTLVFPVGTVSGATQNISVPLLNNGTPEPTENFRVTLTAPSGAILGTNAMHTVQILDDEGVSGLSIGDITVTEGNSGTTNATFTVTLSPANPSATVSASFATADGTATAAGVGSATFSSNQTITIPTGGPASPYGSTISVPALAGPVTRVTVTLSKFTHTYPSDVDVLLVGPGGQKAMLMSDFCDGGSTFEQTLIFSDAATSPLSGCPITSGTYKPTDLNTGADDAFIAPAPAGPYTSTLSVFQGVNPAGTWTLYVQDDFNADAGSLAGWSLTVTTENGGDYNAKTGLVSFAPGQTSRPVTVEVRGDVASEGDETFFVNLTNPINAIINDSQAVATIADDDFFTLSLLVAGTDGGAGIFGSGSVALSEPSGASCFTGPSPCGPFNYPEGTLVTLTATPGPDSVFLGWTGGGCTGTAPCVVPMTANRSVNALFLGPRRLNVLVYGTDGGAGVFGSGSVAFSEPSGTSCFTGPSPCGPFAYRDGTSVTLTATPGPDSVFIGWVGACTGTSQCVVPMTGGNKSVDAVFLGPRRLSVLVYGTNGGAGVFGSGSVSFSEPSGTSCFTGPSPCGPFAYRDGTSVTLTATPGPDSVFIGWVGACTGTSQCVVPMTGGNKSVDAVFLGPRRLSVLVYGTDGGAGIFGSGSVAFSEPSGTSCFTGPSPCGPFAYRDGTSVTLTATPGPDSVFLGWVGACTGTGPCVIPMTGGNKSVDAIFLGPRRLSVLVYGTDGGAGIFGSGAVAFSEPSGTSCVTGPSPCGPFAYREGTSVTLTATPGPDSVFLGWVGACTGTGQCVIPMTGGNKSVDAVFLGPRRLELNVSGLDGGSGVVTYSVPSGDSCASTNTCVRTYRDGTSVTLTATPASGSALMRWTGACSGTSLSCEVVVNGNLVVGATFGPVEAVAWTALVGVSASGNNLTKTGTAGWNAGATSTKAIGSGDGFVEFTASQTASARMLGLSNGNAGVALSDVDFALYLAAGGSLHVYQGGTYGGAVGTYSSGDKLRVAVEAGVVKFRKNGVLLFTSAITPNYPLLVDTSLYSSGATLMDVVLSGMLVDLSAPTEVVVWTGLVGTAASGNDLTKTAATAWNAGAVSTRALGSADGFVEFTATETTTARMLGLSNGNAGTAFGDIDFAFYLTSNGDLRVYEGGMERAIGTYGSGDTLRVAVEAGAIKYRKNGVLFYASSVAPTYPLLVDTSLYTASATLGDVVLSGTLVNVTAIGKPVQWTALVGVTAAENDLTKTGGTGWNAGAASTRAIGVGDGFVEFAVTQTSTARMLGLSNGNPGIAFGDIDFALYLAAGGTLHVYEGGVYTAAVGTYANGDKLKIAVEGGLVRYRKNGTLLFTSAATPTYPLLVDTALYSNGAKLDDTILSGTLVNSAIPGDVVEWTALQGVVATGNDLGKTAGSTGWDAGAASTRALGSGDGFVEFTATETTTARMMGLSNGNASATETDVDFALYLTSTGDLRVYEGGVERAVLGTYTSGDTLRVQVEAGQVKYSRNGMLLYTSAATPTYPLLVDTSFHDTGATLNDAFLSGVLVNASPANEAVVWTALVGVTASGDDLTKTAGTGWNAGAVSTRAIGSGDGYVEFTATQTATARMLGLSNGNAGVAFSDIDFALYLAAGGSLHVYQGGVYAGAVGTYVNGDTLRVAVEGGVVKYRKNGALLFTSANTPTYPLLVDTSLYSSGATLVDVVVSGQLQ